MSSRTTTRFRPSRISCAIQAALATTALAVPLWSHAVAPIDATGNVVNSNGDPASLPASSVIDHPFEAGEKTIIGGYAQYGGNATANSVTLGGSSASNAVPAGFMGTIVGGMSDGGNANNNSITLQAGDYAGVKEILAGQVISGTGTASGNKVEVRGMQSNAWVAGGVVDTATGADANNNTVIMHSGTVGSINGGSANGMGNARGNHVEINGGTVSGQWDEDAQTQILGAIVGADVFHGAATQNTILIRGGTITGLVAGGYVNDSKDYDPGRATGSVTHNTITIEGSSADLRNASLYGGWGATTTGDLFTGNTLNLVNAKGLSAQNVGNFEFLNFYLPENTQNGDTILHVAGTADIQGSTIGVNVQGNAPVLAVGDKVKLIDAGTLLADATIKTRALQGSTIEYEFDTKQEGNILSSTVTRRGATESSKSLSEGFVAGAAALTAAADFAASQGTAAAVSAVTGAGGNTGGQSFGTTGGGSVRNNTGSHVDVRSFNLVAGLAKGFKQANGELTLGGFFEYGNGNYSSFNDFSTGVARGDGKTRSYGLGMMGHYALDSGIYVEGSVRTGRAEQDYQSNDLVPGTRVSYESKTHYVGTHIGAGKVWALNDSLGLDTYAHYIWQRQGSDSVQMSSGETLAFDAVTSQRVRLGARLTKSLSTTISAYVGAGYENELDGKAKATTNGMPIESPSMKGASGLVEVGLNVRPLKNKALLVGVGLQGYFGQKEGVTGSLQIGYKF
ncbi:autotransporter outer membrane beta-barrel domain-containing protein [Comamonas sp. Tr-654]|uniref:autotransporter domain-containing protein n=1 Tax=Comamonas sp. Tr-654 TaxID=2608341 RepID=UPI0014249B6D|nr:autotransporter domain-containing protein [Comamonas sp. Tr-654]NIF85500.1 autotransporter outer membrane beta-barrel domain-containing protein [Comamonas sp. Tr-654]